MLEENAEEATGEEMMRMVAEIVSAYVSYNTIAGSELPNLIRTVHQSLTGTRTAPEPDVEAAQKPAVAIRKSVQPDHIVCLEDGRKLKMLKRYLRTRYNMTPDEYRTKWGLPADYPMVAPNYSNQRSKFAKKIGLGHRRSEAG